MVEMALARPHSHCTSISAGKLQWHLPISKKKKKEMLTVKPHSKWYLMMESLFICQHKVNRENAPGSKSNAPNERGVKIA